jgi:hypothetical protein
MVQLDQGLIRVALGEYDRAYLNLEEGLHTAGRMRLPYMEVQYLLAHAALHATAAASPGSPESLELCDRAARTAASHGFTELLWKSRFERARWLLAAGRDDDAVAEAEAALEPLSRVLGSLPEELREPYLSVSGAEDLMKLAAVREVSYSSEGA